MATLIDLTLGSNSRLQSGKLYCQATGSDGSDNTVQGNHIRWAFANDLGDTHLPKGMYSGQFSIVPAYQCTYGYNNDRDFVVLYRKQYSAKYQTIVDINTAPDNVITNPDNTYRFEYNVVVNGPIVQINNVLYVDFTDIVSCQNNASYVNAADYVKFYQNYNNLIHVGVQDKLSFAIELKIDGLGNQGDYFQTETVSIPDTLDASNKIISSRRSYHPTLNGQQDIRIESENIEYIRINYGNGCYPLVFFLETYFDYIKCSEDGQNPQWTLLEGPNVGTAALTDFAVSIDDNLVYDRLQTKDVANIDAIWPKYNDASAGGSASLNIANYKERWLETNNPSTQLNNNETLSYALDKYLTLSADPSNAQAIEILSALAPDIGSYVISYLEYLKLVALDYHAARMLGMGFIDEDQDVISSGKRYIYVAYYAAFPNSIPNAENYLFMSLPTGLQDYRLPPAPTLQQLTYGLSLPTASGSPTLITDPQGYVPNEPKRYINLIKAPFPYDFPLGSFFQSNVEFNLGEMSRPMMYGVEYKEVNAANWVEPELSNDDYFKDPAGLEETVPIPEQANPIFVHEEENEGIHSYAIYAINWFSRVSHLSNILSTDYTQFNIHYTLLPPLNMTATLIQSEDVLLLTTDEEQNMLSQISGDRTLVRVTFDYNHNHNANYQFGEKVQFFFRENLPVNVRGQISNVIDGLSENRVAVETRDFSIASTNPSQTISPILLQADFPKFIGGLFASDDNQFIINDIIETDASGINPTFILKKIIKNHLVQIPGSQDPQTGEWQYNVVEEFIVPTPGSIFMAVENSSNQNNWQHQLASEVTLNNFNIANPYTEQETELDLTITTTVIGGIPETAVITNITDSNTQPTNFFHVQFSTTGLLPALQTDAYWYKGILRAFNNAGTPEMREYEVVEIKRDATGQIIEPLELIILDAEYDPISGTPHIDTNAGGTDVNYHPSYKFYLYADPANNFDETHILPSFGEGSRKTYLSARIVDTIPASGMVSSYLTMPIEINAREIVEPLPPNVPEGPMYATRPDFYGKATYTFNNKVKLSTPLGAPREPFAYLFYRTSDNSILKALYSDATIANILDALENLVPQDAAFDTDRWSDLANGIYDDATGTGTNQFKIYFAGGFQFPLPDRAGYSVYLKGTSGSYITVYPFASFTDLESVVTGTTLKVIDFVKRAIRSSFTSLTELAVVYKFIKPYSNSYPSPKAVKIRDNNGALLISSDPEYDPAPMTGLYTDGADTYIRFTDYTLNGASKSKYFYYAAEMSNTLKIVNGGIAGPVSLVNAYPPPAPQIRKVTTQLADAIAGLGTAVKFELNNYQKNEQIDKIQIFRAKNALDTGNLRTMEKANIINAGVSSSIEILDDFSDLSQIPYSEPLFYRLIAYRKIKNEFDEEELIPSLPSNVVMCNVVDVINPEAPEILPDISPNPPYSIDVVLNWSPTCYNGKYYLYKMNASGNWNLLTEIESNDANDLTFSMTGLVKTNAANEEFYHRFKVRAENSSGLFNLAEKELTI